MPPAFPTQDVKEVQNTEEPVLERRQMFGNMKVMNCVVKYEIRIELGYVIIIHSDNMLQSNAFAIHSNYKQLWEKKNTYICFSAVILPFS